MSKSSNSEHADDKHGLESRWLQDLPLVALLAAGLLGIVFCLAYLGHKGFDPSKFGQFGDYIGGILNPLISAFTLTVAVSVWKLQREALRVQKAELEQTRAAIEQQTFDQFFMGMLSTYRSMVDQVALVDSTSGQTLQTGTRAVQSYGRQLLTDGEKKSQNSSFMCNLTAETFRVSGFVVREPISTDVLPYLAHFCVRYYARDLIYVADGTDFVLSEYKSNTLSYENLFGHVFRHIDQSLKIIDEQFGDDPDSKRRYINLLRAQMSESEFVFFALSALTRDGEKSWARSIKLNFFKDRLQNLPWTKRLAESFVDSNENLDAAKRILKDE